MAAFIASPLRMLCPSAFSLTSRRIGRPPTSPSTPSRSSSSSPSSFCCCSYYSFLPSTSSRSACLQPQQPPASAGVSSSGRGRSFVTAAAAASSDSQPGSEQGPASVDVLALAEKARLRLESHEVEEYEQSILRITEWFGQLQAVELGDAAAAVHGAGGAFDGAAFTLRADVAKDFGTRDAMMKGVPDMEGSFLRVPRITGGGDD